MNTPDFSKGQKGYLQRFINIFKTDSKDVLDEFETDSKKVIEELNTIKEKVSDELSLVEEKLDSFEEKEETINSKLEEIKEFHTEIFQNNENGYIISEKISGFVEEFEGYKEEIEELKSDIEDYQNKLFGYKDEKGKEFKGIEHKIEDLKNDLSNSIKDSQEQIEEFIETNSTKQDELFNKIESLLKGASTVALAKAFQEHKKSFTASNYMWLILFVFSIMSMMFISVWSFKSSKYNIEDMWKYTLGNLPFLGGAIWLAIYSSKQRSQNKRLQQEYAFKEDVAKIYYGLKQEIEELGTSELGQKLNSKMLETIINVVEDNPSKTLDNNSHNDKGPLLESIKGLGEIVKNIKNPT